MILPDGWKEEQLGNLLDFKNGLNFSQNPNGKRLSFLGVGNFKNKKIIRDVSELDEICLADFPDDDYLLKKDDLVFVRSNGSKELVGRCVIIGEDFDHATYSGFCIRGRLKSETTTAYYIENLIDAGFLRQKLKKDARGSNISNLNQEILGDLLLPFPPLAEQKKIAEVLSAWDKAIELTEKLVAEKELAYSFYVKKLIEEPSKQKVWNEVKLNDILREGEKIPVEDTSLYKKITVKLHKGGLDFFETDRKMSDTRPFYKRHTGELIIGKQNYFNGSIALVSSQFDNCICSNAIMSFSISKKVNGYFVCEALSSNSYLKHHEAFANGTGQKELSESEFLNFTVYLPSLSEQEKIASFLACAKKEITLLRSLATEYRKQKQWLMQKLLTGEMRVTV